MNANDIPSQARVRLKRIKTASRIARWTVLGFLAFAGWRFLWGNYSQFGHTTDLQSVGSRFAMLSCEVVLCFWYWKLAQLFRFYERGMIFASETISCIKDLGCLWVAGWIFMAASHFLYQPRLFQPSTHPPGVTVVTHSYHMGFLSFDFGTGIDFGFLLGGLIVFLIAWIMDEGRKIQEEQALTV